MIKTIAFVLLCATLITAQTFNAFLVELNTTPSAQRQAKVDSFFQATTHFPITEDTLAHFIYKGNANSMAVPGDFSGWDPTKAPMQNVGGTDLWYRTEWFDSDARLDYKYVKNTSSWLLDPRNKFTAPGGFGANSEIRMPDYIFPEEINYNASIAHGSLWDTIYFSTHLQNSRSIKVYLPPGYESVTRSYPLVLVHDGLEYVSFSKMQNVLDNLIAQGKIEPTIALFVPPVERSPEYIDAKQNAFTQFIITELIPWVDGRFRTDKKAEKRMVMGSSAGGNISLWIAMNHPEIFGNVAAFSPYVEQDILDHFQNSSKMDMQLYMLHGKYDHISAIHNSVNAFKPILDSKGYTYIYKEKPEGHSYGFWRAYVDEALIFAFPKQPAHIEENNTPPTGFKLFANFPNPFNPHTTIPFVLQKQSTVQLFVYNAVGQQIYNSSLMSFKSGKNMLKWHGKNQTGVELPSGVYFYRLMVNGHPSKSKKMMLIR